MNEPFILFSAVFGYFAATLLIVKSISPSIAQLSPTSNIHIAYLIASISIVAHSVYAIGLSHLGSSLNFSLSSMTVLVSAILVLIFLLACVAMPIKRLGLLVFPLTALSLVFSYFWNSSDSYFDNHSSAFGAHILVSILAYCLLAIASIQALIYVYQERQIKSHTAATMLLALPPLQTMERLLFRLVAAGFFALTLTLFSGALFSQQIFGQPFEFKHHTVLAIIGWLVFSVLLFKRIRHGIRGSQAAIWVLSGFLLIQLGYFGTKIVTESLKF